MKNLNNLESLAKHILDKKIFDFFAGGSCDEHTLNLNTEIFKKYHIIPKCVFAS
jgi:isopentenyl diphosphate isomerase/L-lactate dehydrogenase-like FMN-dependent dehydrogenase